MKILVAQLLFVSSTAYGHNVIDFMNCDIHLEKKLYYIFFLLTLDILIQQKVICLHLLEMFYSSI